MAIHTITNRNSAGNPKENTFPSRILDIRGVMRLCFWRVVSVFIKSLPMSDPGVEHAVHYVHDEIGHDVDRAEQYHYGLNEREITLDYRGHQQSTDSRPGEDRLGDNGAANQQDKEKYKEGQDRQSRVSESVFP